MSLVVSNDSGLKMTGGLGAGTGQCNRWPSLEVGGAELGDIPEGYNDNFHPIQLLLQ